MSFDFEQGAVHVLRTQQGGGGSTKSVQKRAGGGGVFEALSAHAKSLQNGIVGLCWLVL